MERHARKCLEILALPPVTDASRRRAIAVLVAKAIGRPLADATALLSLVSSTGASRVSGVTIDASAPGAASVRLPRAMADEDASRWASELRALGADVSVVPVDVDGPCLASGHEDLVSSVRCSRCESPMCSLCVALAEGQALCATCRKKGQRSRSFYLARVSFLLLILLGTLLYAWRDHRRRNARYNWDHTLEIGLVIVRVGAVPKDATDAMITRAPALADRLDEEMRRYRPTGARPFHFTVLGPVDATEGPPAAPSEEGLVAAGKRTWALSRYLSPIDKSAGVKASELDARIYVVVRPSTRDRNFVEGASEQGGRVGLVQVEIDKGMIDFALFVTAHEAFHTLGATDRYLADGAILIPDGLGDPGQTPMYPQRSTELMARLRALSPTQGAAPETLSELRVGSTTAREIGWLR